MNKTSSNFRSLVISGVVYFFLLFNCLLSFGQKKDNTITVIIELKKRVDTFSIKSAPLKYNKTFAFSFTLDDGLVSDYLVAYPFFNRGKVDSSYIDQWGYDQGGDGLYYPGLYYTDGCGNKIPFKASLAINAKSIHGADTLLHHGFLTWKQINDLYQAGWGILNHSYTHATGKNVNAKYEIGKNNEVVKEHLGMEMKNFVIPGGYDDMLSNGPYTKAAFDLGMETVQCEDFGNYLINIDPGLSLKSFKLGRLFMHSVTDSVNGTINRMLRLRSGSNRSVHGTETAFLKNIDSYLNDNKIFWINAFTHGVGNQNIWKISLIFPEFKHFFNQLALQYGQKGRDNMWMAPTQEVYEYLLNERSVSYTVRKIRKKLKIVIDKRTLSSDLRYHELTFILTGRKHIKSVRCKGCSVESYSKGKIDNLINIKWE